MNGRFSLDIPGADPAAPLGVVICLRRSRGFRWVALLALLFTIGLYAAEPSHHHKTAAVELHCPVCLVPGAHGAPDPFVPGIHSVLHYRTPYHVAVPDAKPFFLEQSIVAHPPSRAPPLRSAVIS